jgi:hypothetical protein
MLGKGVNELRLGGIIVLTRFALEKYKSYNF